MRRHCFFLLVPVMLANLAAAQTEREGKVSQPGQMGLSGYNKMPLSFAANVGQSNSQVKFLARESGLSLFLTGDEATIVLERPQKASATSLAGNSGTRSNRSDLSTGDTIRMRLLGTNATAQVVGTDELPGKANYFIGNDSTKWRTNVSTYAKVKYKDVYPGVDLVYYGCRGQLEYDFVVSPGADPGPIGLRFQAEQKVKIDGNGNLLLSAEGVRFQKPEVYQEFDGVRKAVEGRYDLVAENTIHFLVGAYDRSKPLIIDPVLNYSTYLGGSLTDNVSAIAVDASQNVYVIGSTTSTDFPTANAFQPVFPSTQTPEAGPSSVFITKIDASGSALAFSTFLGGSGPDFGFGIAVDPSGNIYAAGQAGSDNFPTVNPIQPNRTACCGPGAGSSAFITKMNPTGSALIYSTYLGGFGENHATAIAVDAAGNAYITGFTNTPLLDCSLCSFPTTPDALQPNLGGVSDVAWNAFVTKINPTGSALVFSTYLGGSSHDIGSSIAVDPDGNVYVTGTAMSTDFPTANAIQPHLKAKNPEQTGNHNAFVSKINPTGTAFIYSTYLGGSINDGAGGITADKSGNAYVAGGTSSADFPTAHALQATLKGASNAFLSKINPSGSAFVYSTYLGGSGSDGAGGVAVDHLGNAYIAGSTSSTNFPAHDGPQTNFGGGGSDAFVAQLNPSGNALVYSTYLGGSDDDSGGPIALDPLGNVYVAGNTQSTNFPTVNPLQRSFAGGVPFAGGDAFVAKIGSTIAERLNLSGDETSIGHTCMVDGHVATCGAHFVGWSGGTGHDANGWVASPGDGKAVWEASVAYQGVVAFGKTVELVKGSTLQLLLKPNKLLSEIVTEGTVTWPASVHDDLGCGGGVAKVHALFTTSKDEPGSFVGCLHDLPAGSVLPPKIWGTFFTLKD